ncbi:disease resistance protein At4g27190-like [Neltuma alba]|uniref:disease resistance protein At4g27190-like n=1 Tax=Neltuma alba TaxID=207710 RepID=UPI0010A2BA52|nr:disease resistance protein At4g27190-like [Prosopis alba]
MAEVGVSLAAKLAEYLVDPTLRRLQYLFCVGKITKNVQIRKEELILKQGRVQERVQEAINRTERIDGEVDRWKNDVKSLIAEVEELEDELGANNGCHRRWYPTWRRYCLCKKLAKTTQRMIDLNTKSDRFNPFSHPVIIQGIEYHSSKGFMFFESTKKAHDELWAALQDDDSSMIGLWGMGGSGKTTLVKEIGKKAKESKLCDEVIIATVTQTLNIRKIQGQIADLLGLELKQETEEGRARRIALKLQSSNKRILIILDDVWDTLNLEDIGNPYRDEGPRNCKILLTTRRQEVCTMMDCQKTISLGLLTEGEAWDLFQTHGRVDDGVRKVAQEVVAECKGLPIAIVAMGKCLRRKGLDEMNVVLHRLRHSKPLDEDKAFTCLKLSYDYLRNAEAKLLFLVCAMFPEDHEIEIEDLFRYGVGLGLCKDADSFEIARSQVRAAINVLVDSSLLMFSVSSRKEKCVKMHDIVRDVALWVATQENSTIMVNNGKEWNKLISDEVIKDCYAISSWYDDGILFQFLSQLGAPKLEFLLLDSVKLVDALHASFEGSTGLKALIMMCKYFHRIELQPQSIQHLSNLQTLRLQGWNLRDISFVVSLTRLEILDLRRSMFKRMPNGIENLNKLKLLDLSYCNIGECCYQVIGRCSQLEELYVSTHFPKSKNAKCYECLMAPIALMKLRRYRIEIGGRNIGLTPQNESARYLRFVQLNIAMLGVGIKDLAQIATAIECYKLKGGSRSFMPNVVQASGGMNELSKLYLRRCSEMECIVDKINAHEDAIAPRLGELVLTDMDNLQQLHRGPSSVSLFQKLETLTISNCPQLLHIFPADCNLGNLKFLNIFSCPRLTSLFAISTMCTLLSLQELRIESCGELKHALEGEGDGDAWENSRFPKLKILSIDKCRKLESVCPVFLAQRFVQLQRLSITTAPQMKFVFGENADEEQPLRDQDEIQIALSLLEYLTLTNLPNLVGICSKRYHLRWLSIKTIEGEDCPNLELESHPLRNEEHRSLTTIESIQLHNCGVESISLYKTGSEEQFPTFQSLKKLVLRNHARLKYVFSAHMCQSLPELTSVTISCCEELEAIFLENEKTQKNLANAESCLPKLKRLEVFECNKLKFILSFMIGPTVSMLPQLSTLTVSDSSQMEEIFKCSKVEDHQIDSSEKEITLPNLKSMRLENLPRLVNVCQGFKLQTGEFCTLNVHECPKLMPMMGATIDWTNERLVRKYVLKYNQLNNNEALNLPLSVLNAGELDIRSPGVEHKWRVIGDDEQEETNNSEMLRSEEQMARGLVPTQVLSFQHLHSLEIIKNKKLKQLKLIIKL